MTSKDGGNLHWGGMGMHVELENFDGRLQACRLKKCTVEVLRLRLVAVNVVIDSSRVVPLADQPTFGAFHRALVNL